MVTSYDLLTFRIDKQFFAIAVEPIVQIVSMATITPIPQASRIAKGIINLHGEVVPVVDLRRHLGKPESHYQVHTPIIVIKISGHIVGLIVDEVNDVINLQATLINHPSDILPEELREVVLLSGVVYTPEGVVLILDPEQLFQTDQVQELAKASEFILERVHSGTSGLASSLNKNVSEPIKEA